MSSPPGGRLIAAYKGPAGSDVLAFCRDWVTAAPRPLEVVTVYPGPVPVGVGRTDAEWVAHNRDEAHRLLEQAREELADLPGVSFRAVGADSAPRGLHEALEAAGPGSVVVLGSKKTRDTRRTAPGSTAERLLHGAPGAVTLVPWDYEQRVAGPLRRVAVAYVDTPDARAALDVGLSLADEFGGELTLVSVLPDTRVAPSLGEPGRFAVEQREAFAAAADEVVAGKAPQAQVRTQLLEGPVVDALADLRGEDVDVLVCGSRGYGPVRRVLLGGVSSRLLRTARVPVMVVPRPN